MNTSMRLHALKEYIIVIVFLMFQLVGLLTAFIGISRMFGDYDFVEALFLANIGICASMVAYLTWAKWYDINDPYPKYVPDRKG